LTDRTEYISAARAKYDTYDTDIWIKEYFDEFSGGFNVYHKRHQFAITGGGGEAEKIVGLMLAKYNGKQVEFLPEVGEKKSPDLFFDSLKWDIKYISKANENTIIKDIRDARKANNAIFYWDDDKNKLAELRSAINRSVGYFKSKNMLQTMPDIYYMDKKLLKLLWRKQI
jgi:hypothetical protein